MPDYRRILITGAAGSLGSHLRTGLAPLAERMRLARRPRARRGRRRTRRSCVCDLADRAAALRARPAAATPSCISPAIRASRASRRSSPTPCPAAYHSLRGRAARTAAAASSMPARSTPSASTRSRTVPDTRVDAPARHLLRPDQDLHRGPRQPLLGQVRPRERLLAHLLLLRRAARPADALVLAQLRRLRAAGRGGADRAAGRLLGDLRHLRQRRSAAVSNAHASHIGFRPQDSADGFAAAVLARTERPDPARVADPRGRRRLRRDAAIPTMPADARPRRSFAALARDLAGGRERRRSGPWTLRRGDGGGNRASAATLDGGRPRRTSPPPRRRCAAGGSVRSS